MVSSDPIFSSPKKAAGNKRGQQQRVRFFAILLLAFFVVLWWWKPFGKRTRNKTGDEVYSVVFDAGSTGSRVHVYHFETDKSGALILLNDDFHAIKPGLSAFAGRPAEASKSVSDLLYLVQDSVPESHQADSPCQLRATAGLRLLPGSQADDILEAVQTKLEETDYMVDKNAVSILDGSYEGAYAWLTLNYLLERLDAANSVTVTAIDLGGGSMQESYEVTNSKDTTEDVVFVHSGDAKRPVYVHSYLSYGLMATRARILEVTGEGKDNPCIATGYDGVYPYGGKEYKAVNKGASRPQQECKDIVKEILRLNDPCGHPIDQCTFNGVWGGPIARDRNTRPIYLFSYFWDRAVDVGIITSPEAVTWKTNIDQYTVYATSICGQSLDQLKSKYPSVEKDQLPYLCMDLSYMSLLLTDGLKLDPYEDIHLAKQIPYRGQNIETSWTLGAAIDGMHSK